MHTDELKGDQPAAFDIVTSRIANNERITKLCGYAGSGKTFLLSKIAQWAKDKKIDVTVAAPTHKAAGVISSKIRPDIKVGTIHSLLGLLLVPDMEEDTGERVLRAGDNGPRIKKGLVICDEASMVGRELKRHIDMIPGVNWLFVGDLAQLPPVGEGVSELLNDPDATLNEVLRQAQGSEILNLATRIRQGDMSMEFEAGKDVERLESQEDLFQAALKKFQTPEYEADAAHARMLVFRNSRREEINQRMRQLLIGSPDPYVPGEWLVMYAAFCPEKSRLNVMAGEASQEERGTYEFKDAWRRFFAEKERVMESPLSQLHVSEEVRVTDVEDGTVVVDENDFDVDMLTVEARNGNSYKLPVLMKHELARVEKLSTRYIQEAHDARSRREDCRRGSNAWYEADDARRKAWGRYFALEETFAQVDYAYAMTVHKSQGSTFDHVFVDVPDLMASGGMRQQLLYTACTRPAKSLTFYC